MVFKFYFTYNIVYFFFIFFFFFLLSFLFCLFSFFVFLLLFTIALYTVYSPLPPFSDPPFFPGSRQAAPPHLLIISFLRLWPVADPSAHCLPGPTPPLPIKASGIAESGSGEPGPRAPKGGPGAGGAPGGPHGSLKAGAGPRWRDRKCTKTAKCVILALGSQCNSKSLHSAFPRPIVYIFGLGTPKSGFGPPGGGSGPPQRGGLPESRGGARPPNGGWGPPPWGGRKGPKIGPFQNLTVRLMVGGSKWAQNR